MSPHPERYLGPTLVGTKTNIWMPTRPTCEMSRNRRGYSPKRKTKKKKKKIVRLTQLIRSVPYGTAV